MRRTSWLRAVTLTLAAAVLTTAMAWGADAAPGGKRGRFEQYLQQRLNLTDDQVQALRDIRTRDADARRQQAQALRQAQRELRRLVVTQADEATIEAKQAEVQQLIAQSLQMRTERLKEMSALLTPDQREQFVQMMEERKHGRHGRHGYRMGPRPQAGS